MNTITPQMLISQLNPIEFKSLFKTKPYIHALSMLYNWLLIFVVIYASEALAILWFYPLAVLIIGARMHALAILMHDATHYRFLKNRKWNDLISNLLVMYPIFTSIEKYRKNHLKHHQHLNTMDDPDWVAKLSRRAFEFPKTKTSFLLTVCSYLVLYQGILDALWFLKRFGGKEEKKKASKNNPFWNIGFYVVLILSLTLLGAWKLYLMYWLVPYFSSFFMFQYIRSVAEHFGDLAYENELSFSRTVKTSFLERFLIAPHHVAYHLEHHLYPAVPFYHLPKLHKLLMKQEAYKQHAHITNGYMTGLLKELGK